MDTVVHGVRRECARRLLEARVRVGEKQRIGARPSTQGRQVGTNPDRYAPGDGIILLSDEASGRLAAGPEGATISANFAPRQLLDQEEDPEPGNPLRTDRPDKHGPRTRRWRQYPRDESIQAQLARRYVRDDRSLRSIRAHDRTNRRDHTRDAESAPESPPPPLRRRHRSQSQSPRPAP